MKATNNTQTTESTNNSENTPTWQDYIVEDLSDDAQAAVSGGRTWTMPWSITSAEEAGRLAAQGGGIG
jgi:hypothetical protein